VSGVEIQFSVADGNIEEAEEEDGGTPDIFQEGNDTIQGMTSSSSGLPRDNCLQ
jgi:hypothetical protein